MRLRKSESLFITRRREGLTQTAMADKLGIMEYIYFQYENGTSEIPEGLTGLPIFAEPTALEQCVIKRRRLAMSQDELAAELGCSRFWVNQMETDKVNPGKLIKYWSDK